MTWLGLILIYGWDNYRLKCIDLNSMDLIKFTQIQSNWICLNWIECIFLSLTCLDLLVNCLKVNWFERTRIKSICLESIWADAQLDDWASYAHHRDSPTSFWTVFSEASPACCDCIGIRRCSLQNSRLIIQTYGLPLRYFLIKINWKWTAGVASTGLRADGGPSRMRTATRLEKNSYEPSSAARGSFQTLPIKPPCGW